jgi:hypothetical protein
MQRLMGESASIAFLVLLGACSTPRVSNAPPEVVEACEREIALLTNRDLPPLQGDTMPGVGAPGDAIDEARVGRAEAEAGGIAAWPDDALMYRCLASRGIELDVEQAKVLAEWEQKSRRNREP